MDTWKLQDAKARFSEVVERAVNDGPQLVTRHGKKAVVVVSYDQFAREDASEDFKSFLTSVPLAELELDRPRRLPRKTSL